MYASTADMVARFDRPEQPELTQLIPLAGSSPASVDLTRLAEVLAEASGQMDSYLGTRNALPLSVSAEQAADLKRVCCDIARYRLWDDAASDEVRKRYEDALAFLKAVAAGDVVLGGADTSGAAAIARATLSSQPRRMTRDSLNGVI